jgi:dTDP-4-amino-4,6-dideoxy-D-galactose acyltransferase
MTDSTESGLILDWDSEFWGVTIGRITGDTLSGKRWTDVDRWARAQGVDCLYFLARPDEAETLAVAQQAGFRLVDVRVELAQPSADAEPAPRIRAHEPADLDTLRTIARTSHEITRFYADPQFPKERCDDLYDTWITRSCEGWADAVLVAELDARAAGYVTCDIDHVSGQGSIGLIAVSAAARGNGLGRDLVNGALRWCRDHGSSEVSVVTQVANTAAQRLFQFCGFRTSSTGLWFHYWYQR